MLESFILGLSTGSACLATCGMVLVPYFISGEGSVKKTYADLGIFLGTRLIAYAFLAALSFYFGRLVFQNPLVQTWITGSLFVLFSVMLIAYSLRLMKQHTCALGTMERKKISRMIPFTLGILSSVGFCPALLLAITEGASRQNLVQSEISFLLFFAGTSVWFLPLPLTAGASNRKILRTIGILATGLAGIIYCIKGIILLIGGLYG